MEDQQMRCLIAAMGLLLWPLTPAVAQVSIGIGLPSVSIGIDIPVYPTMVPVPGYPVYYAPNVGSNYFFYDGLYWVYAGDNWYASSWYNGPWTLRGRDLIPAFILRVPVRYYRHPPAYFAGWRPEAAPRWGEHWGGDWQRHHSGWDTWNRRAVPRPAPLPTYQSRYSGARYPQADQQRALHDRNYQYRPRDSTVRQAYQAQGLHDRGQPARSGNTMMGQGTMGQGAMSPRQRDVPRTGRASPAPMASRPGMMTSGRTQPRAPGSEAQEAKGKAPGPGGHAGRTGGGEERRTDGGR
jgi:hypothetical protein